MHERGPPLLPHPSSHAQPTGQVTQTPLSSTIWRGVWRGRGGIAASQISGILSLSSLGNVQEKKKMK